MKMLHVVLIPLSLTLIVLLAALGHGQYAPPPAVPPAPEKLKEIQGRIAKLGREIDRLRSLGVRDFYLAEIEIFLKAAQWIVKHNEFYSKDAPDWTLAMLDRGSLRASSVLAGEGAWMSQAGFSVVRAYRSRVDGSLQPYAVTLPADYGKNTDRKWRIDVVLHGRNPGLTEVSFLRQFSSDKPAPKDLNHVQIDIYGRGNNAYRWAGETDVWEALESFLAVEQILGRGGLMDPQRMVLRGFSMGGAGSWHLGLHRPDRWCVIGPGAGFTATHGYIKDLPAKLPEPQESCLTIYDAVDYAENAFNVPVVAYGGDKDPQLQAARNIQERLKNTNIPMTLLVAPGLEHQFPPEWQQKAEEEYSKHVVKGRQTLPRQVRFVTYTLRYPACDWVNIMGLEKHYQRTLVDARLTDEGFAVKTENVRLLDLRLWPGSTRASIKAEIDGDHLELWPYQTPFDGLHVYLEHQVGVRPAWRAVLPERLQVAQLRNPQKVAGMQGPIDDAFMGSFLCVRGTGKAWSPQVQAYTEAALERFRQEWSKYWRGDLPVKDDIDVTPEDMATRHLVLFGDPGSNALIEQVLPGLPFKWTQEWLYWNGEKKWSARDTVPVLIYPSPLNTDRYVILNSGHTFHAAELQGTNAQLYPRLGDFALLSLDSQQKDPLAARVAVSGLFDEYWRLPKQP